MMTQFIRRWLAHSQLGNGRRSGVFDVGLSLARVSTDGPSLPSFVIVNSMLLKRMLTLGTVMEHDEAIGSDKKNVTHPYLAHQLSVFFTSD
jgi:hypothetical protein